MYLGIKKKGKEFIHLTIHLVPKELNPKKDGIIHIFKNIYKKNVNRKVYGNKRTNLPVDIDNLKYLWISYI